MTRYKDSMATKALVIVVPPKGPILQYLGLANLTDADVEIIRNDLTAELTRRDFIRKQQGG